MIIMTEFLAVCLLEYCIILVTKKPLPKQKYSCETDTSYNDDESNKKEKHMIPLRKPMLALSHIQSRKPLGYLRIADESDAMLVWRSLA